jgi:hypothetical protein
MKHSTLGKFYLKLMDIYTLDLACVRDGDPPNSLAMRLACQDMTPEETIEFLEARIAMVVAALLRL